MKVQYLPQPEWGVGHLVSLADGGTKAVVIFPGREDAGPVMVAARGGALVQVELKAGHPVRTVPGAVGVVRRTLGDAEARRYLVGLEGGAEQELAEAELRALPPKPDTLTTLKEGRVSDAKNFLLRKAALRLDDERRNDALGALLASRVMVKPHQVGVVQRVLSARRPRFVLADEVGLGKTIEAGMIFSALRLAGLARRVLVVAPSHLTLQWLVELFHKFNHLFTLMDAERFAQSQEEAPDVSPWARFDLVVTSLELLQRSEEHREVLAHKSTAWDLVIFDEAHHLKGEKAYEAASALAGNTWGLLLLTATPMQLDPAEYQALLSLIDPVTAPTVAEFEARLAKQETLSKVLRALLEGKQAKKALGELKAQFPADEALAELEEPDELLGHLAETYSLSDRLIRNRRAVVGGFSTRRLHVHAVALTQAELDARNQALEALAGSQVRGAALAAVVRRLESSPLAFQNALLASKALAGVKVTLPPQDAKYAAFFSLLKGIWAAERDAKVLVFTEAKDTLEYVQGRLRHEQLEALSYHGELPLAERDRQVARFRDPEGPKVLICTEVGGEGRNFQFAHHLVHYDLPWSPATVEQRIGRLDRIGQSQPVDIHVFEPKGTFAADVLTVLRDAVGVFGETVGGLDAVLEEVESRLGELALAKASERSAYVAELSKKVAEARAQVKRAYDPLLDLRSFDRAEVEALVARAHERSGMDGEEGESLEDGLWAIARDLDERLEETVTELADRVGIKVDTDKEVDAFQCAFHFGHTLAVEALPGFDVAEERTVLGTFWRDTAVEQEEIEYFATGHPLVESLFGFLRDGPYGRNGGRFVEVKGALRARGLEVLFHVTPPQPADTSPGARVPSRQLSRFLDTQLLSVCVSLGATGRPTVDAKVKGALDDAEGRPLKASELLAAFPELPRFAEAGLATAEAWAKERLEALKAKALEAIEEERDASLVRMKLSLLHQGLGPTKVELVLAQELRFYDAVCASLKATTVTLDSVCAYVINR